MIYFHHSYPQYPAADVAINNLRILSLKKLDIFHDFFHFWLFSIFSQIALSQTSIK
jgi:hypothetical protein